MTRYKAVACSLALAVLVLTSVKADRLQAQNKPAGVGFTPLDFIAPIPKSSSAPTPTPKPTLPPLDLSTIDELIILDYRLELESLGYYYITAYSPLETGSWYTASGTYCHAADYENRYIEPTTCAVDASIHHIGGEDGDLFYIPEFDTVYRAEDTGGLVKGKHIDVCFTDDTLDSVYYFPTGYYEVFAVDVIEYSRIKE